MNQEWIKCRGKVIGMLEDGVFHQKLSALSTYNNSNSKGMDIEEVHRSLNGRCNWWKLTFPDGSQLRIRFSEISEVGTVKAHPKGVGSQYMVNYRYFSDARAVLQSKFAIPSPRFCSECGADLVRKNADPPAHVCLRPGCKLQAIEV